ncbi:MAG TPA: hypothetical protein VMA83_10425 [Solirubrobacteraceae bacterium]|nr:hypothetical protein [Solirubrobacteraceae bacterium]
MAVDTVLASTDDVAVCLSRVDAFPEGITFDVVSLLRPGADVDAFDAFDGRDRRRFFDRSDGAPPPPEMLRIGVEFADGSTVTNTAGTIGAWGDGHRMRIDPAADDEGDEPPPRGPVLSESGGSGSNNYARQSYWLWPLPEDGAITFVCEWPGVGIGVTRTPVDASLFTEAAARARVVFEGLGPPRLRIG